MKKACLRPLIILLWLLLWQLLSRVVNSLLLLPGPIDTLSTLVALAQTMAFWQSLLDSMLRILGGYLLAVLLGSLLAVLCSLSAAVSAFLEPLRSLIRSTPISSFIILVLLYLRVDRVPVFIAMLTVLPIVWQSLQQGISEVDPLLLEMGRAYGFGIKKLLLHIYLPSVRPYFYAGCATAIGFAWKAGIAAEVIARPALSIGRNLQDAKVYLRTEELFAWTLAIVLLSLLLEALLKRLMKRSKGEGMPHAH